MSMTVDAVKKFVEEDYKDYTILVTCDNEHHFWHRSYGNPSVVWDWDNGVFTALQSHEDVIDQNKYPMQITMVAIEEIQFLTAFVDSAAVLDYINNNYTDEKEKEKAKGILQIIKPGQMGPRTLRRTRLGPEKDGKNE